MTKFMQHTRGEMAQWEDTQAKELVKIRASQRHLIYNVVAYLLISIIEYWLAAVSKSQTLRADAFNNLSGIVSTVLLMLGLHIAQDVDDDDIIGDIMETNVITVDTLLDKELVAKQFEKYDFLALPVVDKEQRIVGIVTFDDAMDVMQEENTEDFSHMAGMQPIEDSYFKTSVFKHARNRIAWLLVLMLSATLTSSIITSYEAAFAAVPLLVSFIPMLTGTGGNCGSQTSTMIIRGMSLGEIRLRDFFKVVFKEFRIALIVSVILALVNGIRIYVTYAYFSKGAIDSPFLLALTVSLAIISTVIMSKLIGCMLPMLAKRLHLDPALMAAPLISTIVDATTTLVFFNIAMQIFDIHTI